MRLGMASGIGSNALRPERKRQRERVSSDCVYCPVAVTLHRTVKATLEVPGKVGIA